MPELLTDTDTLLRILAYLGGGVAALIVAAVVLTLTSGFLFRRIGRATGSERITERLLGIHRTIRSLLILVTVVAVCGLVGGAGWLVYGNVDPVDWAWAQMQTIAPDTWISLLTDLGIVVVVALGTVIVNRSLKRMCTAMANRVKRWGAVEANDPAIDRFFLGLGKALTNTAWLLVLVFAAERLDLPDGVTAVLVRLATIYLIIAVGVIVIRATAVVVDTCDALSNRITAATRRSHFYQQLRPLIPLLRRCLEYALWVGVATLVLAQLTPIAGLARYGPPIIQAIGIFFLARVAVEVANLLIDRFMLGDNDLDELERKRRHTVVPLIKTITRQVILFAGLVLMLGAIGFDPMPFLAGAGILGVVLGLGAQPLINDVVSGFFILFENTFLVGDTIRTTGATGDGQSAYGVVESIDFRTTKLRDPDGNLHILRNGDLRHVINYSKEYTYAVLEVAVAYGADVDRALQVMAEAGSKLEQDERVLGSLEVKGITALDEAGARLRAVMRVVPGEHFPISAALRLAVVTAFARNGIPLAAHRHQVVVRQTGSGGTALVRNDQPARGS